MNRSETLLPKHFNSKPTEIMLGYLKYEGSQADKLSFPIQMRERHLTQGQTECEMQAIGPQLQISAWTERDNIVIRLPLSEWHTTGTYTNKLGGANNGHLSVGMFSDYLEVVEYEDSYGIAGFLYTHDMEDSE